MKHLYRHLDDLLILAGCGLIIYAIAQLSAVAAMIAAGVIMIGLGVLVGLGGEQ